MNNAEREQTSQMNPPQPPTTSGKTNADGCPTSSDVGSRFQNPQNARSQTKPLRRAHQTQLIGGLLLTTAFFLPAVESCKRSIVPANELIKTIQHPSNLGDITGACTTYGTPYLFGALIAIGSMTALKRKTPNTNRTNAAIAWLFALIVIIAVIATAIEVILNNHQAPDDLIFSAIICMIAIYTIRALAKGQAARVSLKCFVSLVSILWFAPWIFSKGTLYGLYISTTGSILITIGSFNELRARTLTSSTKTILNILLCNPKLIDQDPTRCNHCGYNITHLTTPRCPECGQPCTIPNNPM